MSGHQKRLTTPNAWRIAKKANTFITKTAPGPHTKEAMPVAVWLRDHMGFARTMKEVKKILSDRAVIVNGTPARDPRMGIGVFDIISIPAMEKHYRILLDKRGNLVSIEITADAATTRLCKIRDKTEVKGGRVQLNLRYGANIIADHRYRPRDSVVLSLEDSNRFAIVDHFPFQTGNVAMIIGGRHSGKVGRIVEITLSGGSIPNKVTLDELENGTRFDTIDEYVFMVGREEPAVQEWGIEA
ncbi:MAG: 30S ribosomal protein S4e [Methanomicrobiaceae archaeon]|nr:30S ribosomal protein S4e [Methanomicrobiaceae archaeon]